MAGIQVNCDAHHMAALVPLLRRPLPPLTYGCCWLPFTVVRKLGCISNKDFLNAL